MKLLFLAPQPFFQERGTPIAVRLALMVLAERYIGQAAGGGNSEIDLLVYHEGSDVAIPGVRIHRIRVPRFLARFTRAVGPGVSLKKLLCDVFFLIAALKLVLSKRNDPYNLVHAVEEGVFVAMLIKLITGIPYIYDMDSSLAMQLTEKWRILRPAHAILSWFEKIAVRYSMAVAPVCDALGVIAQKHGAKETVILRDISLIDPEHCNTAIDLKSECGFSAGDILGLYVGNLEHYQGIDLLLDSTALARERGAPLKVAIIGGTAHDCRRYHSKVESMNLGADVAVLGARPVSALGDYITQADILISPRIMGNNTPMKIYSYLHSGKAIVATKLATHTQVLDQHTALLAEPTPHSFAEALQRVAGDGELRRALGARARALAEERYTFPIFSRELNHLYDQVTREQLAGSQKFASR